MSSVKARGAPHTHCGMEATSNADDGQKTSRPSGKRSLDDFGVTPPQRIAEDTPSSSFLEFVSNSAFKCKAMFGTLHRRRISCLPSLFVFLYTSPFIVDMLGRSQAVRQRPLEPSTKVRILPPQPDANTSAATASVAALCSASLYTAAATSLSRSKSLRLALMVI